MHKGRLFAFIRRKKLFFCQCKEIYDKIGKEQGGDEDAAMSDLSNRADKNRETNEM